MVIFSIISLISYQALQTYTIHQKLSFKHFQNIQNLQKTVLFIKRDASQLFEQNIRLKNSVLQLESLQNDVLIKLRYRLDDGVLLREDISDEDNPIVLNLLDRIDKMTIRLLPARGGLDDWLTNYDSAIAQRAYITTLELKLEHKDWGKIKQWVVIGE